MLRLTFYSADGGTPLQTRATYFRLCPDGTLRGSDNAIAAIRADDRWQIGRRYFRDVECIGPVWLRFRKDLDAMPATMGPYACVKTADGQLYADDIALAINIPGWGRSTDGVCAEVSLLPSEFP